MRPASTWWVTTLCAYPLDGLHFIMPQERMKITMAFVPGYDNDIFVSYAHVDNVPLPGAEEGWVSTLMRGLKTRLAQLLGRSGDFVVWRDPNLSAHEPLTPQLLDALTQSATLLIVL